jgi:hypothetical protein
MKRNAADGLFTKPSKRGRSMRPEGEVVLIYYQDQPAVYARIERIERDIKKDWYQVTLLFLTMPTQVVTWILREEYIDGTPFTMGGRPIRLEAVERIPKEKDASRSPDTTGQKKDGPTTSGKVLPFKKT